MGEPAIIMPLSNLSSSSSNSCMKLDMVNSNYQKIGWVMLACRRQVIYMLNIEVKSSVGDKKKKNFHTLLAN